MAIKESRLIIEGIEVPLYSLNTLIIGSGAAALNAAVRLSELGQRDIAIATEEFGGGTSSNSGSDKQTYYKLSLAGDVPDSAFAMAEDLARGGSMHGDIALCEAQNSVEAFFHLVRLGVPFPQDRFGAYVGYRTDHDPRQRATSAGPLTSRLMFECLAREARRRKIRIFDRHQIIGLLVESRGDQKKAIGAIAIDGERAESRNFGFVVFNAVNTILGTGGPAGIYKASVYPESQTGSHGLAFEAGAVGMNLTESQFGLASTRFRWNLSGSYQQVIPRYISTDRKGGDRREFLNDVFPDMGILATAIFLKGYEWPLDPQKVSRYGSSLIDILVYRESVVKGRRVFLDFRSNPWGAGKLADFSFDLLKPEARVYLEKSGALLPTPIERLAKMNPAAVEIYQRHGIDLAKEPVEVAVCAQHNNGGFAGNVWWESDIRHLFPVGEVSGTHGVYRPGGAALNSGQVGATRAALFIAKRYRGRPLAAKEFLAAARPLIAAKLLFARTMIDHKVQTRGLIKRARFEIMERMSAHGGPIRNGETIAKAAESAWKLWQRLKTGLKVPSGRDLPAAFKALDLCLTHAIYLEAIREYIEKGGASRGSYLVLNAKGEKPCPELEDSWKFSLARRDDYVSRNILEIRLDENLRLHKRWVAVRPIPSPDSWFENVWADFREDRIIR
jgi:succinate dehydrogenase/fumarate reductase flavoprotein subunit